jgi:penicillin-binding protein 1C
LPLPLRRFEPRLAKEATDTLTLVFPPKGSRLELGADVPIKLRGGTPPYSVLTNGEPALTRQNGTEFFLPSPGPGFMTVTVLDSRGQSDGLDLELLNR